MAYIGREHRGCDKFGQGLRQRIKRGHEIAAYIKEASFPAVLQETDKGAVKSMRRFLLEAGVEP